jgi:zinc transport system permease protein
VELLDLLYRAAGLFYEPMFMQRASVAMALLTLTASACGVLVVNRKLSFFPDAVGHTIFAAAALATIANLDVEFSFLALGAGVGLLITFLASKGQLAPDAVIGLVFSGTVAFGLALASRSPQGSAGLTRFFLGDILTVDDNQVMALLILNLLTFFVLYFFSNSLTLSSVLPKAGGRAVIGEYVFGAYLALVVMVAVQAVGVLLVTALLVAPAASGRVLALSFKGMFWGAIFCGALAGQLGLWASFQEEVNASAGAMVVLANVFFFTLAWVYRRFFPARGQGRV